MNAVGAEVWVKTKLVFCSPTTNAAKYDVTEEVFVRLTVICAVEPLVYDQFIVPWNAAP